MTSSSLTFEQLPENLNQWGDAVSALSDAHYYLLTATGLQPAAANISAAGYLVLWAEQLSVGALQSLATQIEGAQLFPVALIDNGVQIVLALKEVATDLKERITAFAAEFRADFALVDALPSLSQPGLVLMDMDSTAIQIECIDEIAKLAGIGDKVSEVTALAMQGKLDFEQSLRARVALLENADESIIATVKEQLPLMPGLRFLVDSLKAHGWKVAVASGGFTYFANKLKEMVGLDHIEANELEIIDGKLTGKVQGRVVDAQVKADTLSVLAQRYGIEMSQTVAVGDGANDLKMMGAAALGVALHPKPIVQQQAQVSLLNCDLEGVWYLLNADKIRALTW